MKKIVIENNGTENYNIAKGYKNFFPKSKSHESFKKPDLDSHKGNNHGHKFHVHKLIFPKSDLEKNQSISVDSPETNHNSKVNIHVINHKHNIDSYNHSQHSGPPSPHPHHKSSNYNPNHSKRQSVEISNFKVNSKDLNELEDDSTSTIVSANKRVSLGKTSKHSSDSSGVDKSNSKVPFSNGNVQIDKEGFLEEIDLIRNFCGNGMSDLIAGLGGDFAFEDSDSI